VPLPMLWRTSLRPVGDDRSLTIMMWGRLGGTMQVTRSPASNVRIPFVGSISHPLRLK
jgi:hypothetical protein